jgi:FkbM family methyltransferase
MSRISKSPRGVGRPLGRGTRIVMSSLIWLGVLAIAGEVALTWYPGLLILPSAPGLTYSPYCGVWQGVRDGHVKIERAQLARQIHEQSHLVKTEGHFKLWSTPKGEYWVPDTSDSILSILLAQQQTRIYGDAETGGVRNGDIVLDGGAHIGTYVRTALEAGASTVVAIEPSPEALWSLHRNFAEEIAAGKVIVYEKGIWDEEKTLLLYANGNGAAGDSFLAEGLGARKIADIPVTTIDRIVKELNLPRVDMIKADIKGAGTRMILGAKETLRKYHPRLVISTEEAPEDPAAIRQAVMNVDPGYQFRPGPCLFTGRNELRNDTIFFQ